MQYFFLTVAAAAFYVAAQATESLVPVGHNCHPNGTACAEGANCYAVNSMQQTVCGNFQSSCTKDEQCAFNTCNLQQGLCNGFLSSSASSSATAPPATSSTACPAPGSTDNQGRYSCNPAHQYPLEQQCIVIDGCYYISPTVSSTAGSASTSLPTTPAGTLPLGAQCDPLATPSPCAGGAQCWASNSMLIAACGNFNAACKQDSECAFNTCNNGLCNGFKSTVISNGTSTAQTTGGYAATSTPTGTYAPPAFTGAATIPRTVEKGGLMAVFIAAVAWIM
ncbi:hypothetical protein PMIN06_003274 [Paraphaeosphaeria minitans]|uniref:Uncharacterized protein n=1 Tax=Paraphaeosphaeria minitans TaxID=565426 RepID=A0A9P6G5T1_9PLEO|nr:hypothetical protein PMIN01_12481 [Paraphaeosphaeria minitans]